MANPTRHLKIALFDRGKVQEFMEAIVESIRPNAKNWLDFDVTISSHEYEDWCSEALAKSIIGFDRKMKDKLPCLALSANLRDVYCDGAITSLLFHLFMHATKNHDKNDLTTVLGTIAKHYGCCLQTTWREHSTETRHVGMFDGTVLKIEGDEPPFLDVVYKHWEEAMMHLTLNGEVQDEAQQS